MLDPKLRQTLLERLGRIPVFNALGFRVEELGRGSCRVVVPHDRRFDGIFESYHGGLLATVADSCACIAILTLTGPDEPLTTTDFNIRFLAACLTEVTAKAKVIKLGRTLCPVHVELFDAAARMVAVSQVTYMRLPAPPRHADRRTGESADR
ncbi:MAG: PaaI family thioesterase [Phycisphaerales bacterium]|nr:PaaI family thioesterase [Phycisphaerales bacterium]